MPFFSPSDLPCKVICPGVSIQTIWGKHLMMAFVLFEYENAVAPLHQHPHEQMSLCLEGEFELTIAEEVHRLNPGDCYYVPSDVIHCVRSLNGPARMLDIFYPIRE